MERNYVKKDYYNGFSYLGYDSIVVHAFWSKWNSYCTSELFGIPERFSVFAATGFNAILGFCLFIGFPPTKRLPI